MNNSCDQRSITGYYRFAFTWGSTFIWHLRFSGKDFKAACE